jgi:uridine phosphorylase
MSQFPETELILTSEKRLYHIHLKGEDIADNVIIVGDQNRVAQISRYFSKIEFKTAHREFITHTGIYNGNRITVLSTGIGTDNIDIVLNELDAAVNIDPVKRELNSKHRSLNIFRLGTSGSLQADIPVNALVASSHGLGLDGLLNFYAGTKSINETWITNAFKEQVSWLPGLPEPYCISASRDLLDKFKDNVFTTGITATAPGFYGPQGRQIRLKTAMPDLNDQLTTFKLQDLRITNFEMETSALYGLGKLLGHRCLTICVIIANRVRKEFSKDYSGSVDLLIENCLQKLSE